VVFIVLVVVDLFIGLAVMVGLHGLWCVWVVIFVM